MSSTEQLWGAKRVSSIRIFFGHTKCRKGYHMWTNRRMVIGQNLADFLVGRALNPDMHNTMNQWNTKLAGNKRNNAETKIIIIINIFKRHWAYQHAISNFTTPQWSSRPDTHTHTYTLHAHEYLKLAGTWPWAGATMAGMRNAGRGHWVGLDCISFRAGGVQPGCKFSNVCPSWLVSTVCQLLAKPVRVNLCDGDHVENVSNAGLVQCWNLETLLGCTQGAWRNALLWNKTATFVCFDCRRFAQIWNKCGLRNAPSLVFGCGWLSTWHGSESAPSAPRMCYHGCGIWWCDARPGPLVYLGHGACDRKQVFNTMNEPLWVAPISAAQVCCSRRDSLECGLQGRDFYVFCGPVGCNDELQTPGGCTANNSSRQWHVFPPCKSQCGDKIIPRCLVCAMFCDFWHILARPCPQCRFILTGIRGGWDLNDGSRRLTID